MKQVVCPLCGGFVEHDDPAELVRLAQMHTVDAHQYVVPIEHVLQSIEDVEDNG